MQIAFHKYHYHNLFGSHIAQVRSNIMDSSRFHCLPKPAWFLRLPEIPEEVRALRTPVSGPRWCSNGLFRMSCRRASQLMHRFGGYQTCKTFLINYGQLIAELDHIAARPDYIFELPAQATPGGMHRTTWSATGPLPW
jgi:hypothetical protein